MFFQYFQWELGEADINNFPTVDHACFPAGFHKFSFKFKESNS